MKAVFQAPRGRQAGGLVPLLQELKPSNQRSVITPKFRYLGQDAWELNQHFLVTYGIGGDSRLRMDLRMAVGSDRDDNLVLYVEDILFDTTAEGLLQWLASLVGLPVEEMLSTLGEVLKDLINEEIDNIINRERWRVETALAAQGVDGTAATTLRSHGRPEGFEFVILEDWPEQLTKRQIRRAKRRIAFGRRLLGSQNPCDREYEDSRVGYTDSIFSPPQPSDPMVFGDEDRSIQALRNRLRARRLQP